MVEVCWAAPRALCDGWACLSAAERAHAALRGDGRAREHFVAGRTLLRRVLSTHYGGAECVPLAPPAHAAPRLEDGSRALSLSHCDGLVVCAHGEVPALGVDAEPRDRRLPRALALAQRRFAPSEFHALAALPEADRAARFLALFCLKEAHLKALGRGIGGGLATPAFELLEDAGALRVRAHGPSAAGVDHRLDCLPSGHWLALAVRWNGATREVEQRAFGARESEAHEVEAHERAG